MAAYLITCTRKSTRTPAGHRHIISVGIGAEQYTVAQIYRFIDQRHAFYTVSKSSGKEAYVAPFKCPCGIHTLKSYSDGQWDNNLDNLPKCG